MHGYRTYREDEEAMYPKIRRIRDPVFGNTVEQIRDFPYKGLKGVPY